MKIVSRHRRIERMDFVSNESIEYMVWSEKKWKKDRENEMSSPAILNARDQA
jgi:hypothetical protein